MEEGSGQDYTARSNGGIGASSPGKQKEAARKTVKMSETSDFIPYAAAAADTNSDGTCAHRLLADLDRFFYRSCHCFQGSHLGFSWCESSDDSAGGSKTSGSTGAVMPSAQPLDVASCTGLPDVPYEGMQDTPDYIRRGAARHKIAPVELFSDPSPAEPSLTEPSQAKGSAAATLEASSNDAAVPEIGEGIGGVHETMGCQSVQETLHMQEGKCNCCGQLKQEYDLLLREKEECRTLLEDLMRENELKSRECHKAQASLHELKMELMRKSMHVGSLGVDVRAPDFITRITGIQKVCGRCYTNDCNNSAVCSFKVILGCSLLFIQGMTSRDYFENLRSMIFQGQEVMQQKRWS